MPETFTMTVDLILDFYLDGFLAALAVGLVAPWLGTLLVARRMPFLAVAVPQLSGCGVALVWLLFPLLASTDVADVLHPADVPLPPRWLQLAGSALVLVIGLAALTLAGRRSPDTGLHAAVAYLVALGLTELFFLESIYEEFADHAHHHGRILTVAHDGMILVAVTATLILGTAVTTRRGLWTSAFDPDLARLQGISPTRALLGTLLLAGALSALCVPIVGPEVVLALMLVPPALLKRASPSLALYGPLSSAAGGLGATASFFLAVHKDWPIGAALLVSTLASSAVVAGAALLVRRLRTSDRASS